MDIIFVNPPKKYSPGGWSIFHGELPPLGLCSLASVLTKHGFSSSIVDANVLRVSCEKTAEGIVSANPLYVGITASTNTIHDAAQLAKRIKDTNKDIIVLIGGAHVSAVPEETMNMFGEFDIGVLGEAELTIVELVKALKRNSDLSGIAGLILRRTGGLHKTEKRNFIENLDELPLPAWDMLPNLVKYYQPAVTNYKKFPSASIVTSRGCPGKCVFCDRSIFGNLCRAHSAEYVVGMMKRLNKDYGITDFDICDDNFVTFKSRLKTICEILLRENSKFAWSCLARVDMVDRERLQLMKDAGCWQINYGIESGSQKVLDILQKGVTLEKIENAVRLTKKAGISVKGFFMLGCFGETEDSIRETIAFIKKIDLDDIRFTYFTPLPGSDSYKMAASYGVLDGDYRKMDMATPVFIPQDLTKAQLMRAYVKAYNCFLFRFKTIGIFIDILKSSHKLPRMIKSLAFFAARESR